VRLAGGAGDVHDAAMPGDPRAAPPPARLFRPAAPVVLGLVGGVAAGKSTVAAAFGAHGLCRIDADEVARAVSSEAPVLQAIAEAFGAGVVRGGALDRAALAAVVFRDPAARARLEAILHPPIRARILAALAAAKARGDSVLLDVPLLLENGLIAECDHVVFVHAADATRCARAAARGWSPEELARREAAQAPLAEKRRHAAFTVDNDADLATMRTAVAAVLKAISP
jgi:dephospho-CoA kinase